MRNHYSVLGISKDAPQHEVIRAYKLLAKKFHPDRNLSPGAHEKFIEIHEAYSVLREPSRRYQYDRSQLIRRPSYDRNYSAASHSFVYQSVEDEGFNRKLAISTPFVIVVSFLGIVFTSLIGIAIIAAPALLYFLFDFIPGIPVRMLVLVTIALPYWYMLYKVFEKFHWR